MALPSDDDKRLFVERMFDAIAGRYDLMNRIMTFGVDRGWREAAVATLGIRPGARVIDLGCGTGDLSEEAARAGAAVVGVDVSAAMLERAARRLPQCTFTRADAQQLPLRDGSCDAMVSGFALRNFVSVADVLCESARVLRSGACIALLEVDLPSSMLGRFAFDAYFGRVVPFVGRIVSEGYAYEYLSASLAYLPSERDLTAMLFRAGFERMEKQRLGMGTAQLVTAVRI